jgi:hypothetical protein
MLCAVINEKAIECFVPGVVQSIKVSLDNKNINKYLILYFNGQYGENLSCELVKITKNLYGVIVDHIFHEWPMQT